MCSCPKMRYKAEYQPSRLLCMTSLVWVRYDAAVAHLHMDRHCMLTEVIQVAHLTRCGMHPCVLTLLFFDTNTSLLGNEGLSQLRNPC